MTSRNFPFIFTQLWFFYVRSPETGEKFALTSFARNFPKRVDPQNKTQSISTNFQQFMLHFNFWYYCKYRLNLLFRKLSLATIHPKVKGCISMQSYKICHGCIRFQTNPLHWGKYCRILCFISSSNLEFLIAFFLAILQVTHETPKLHENGTNIHRNVTSLDFIHLQKIELFFGFLCSFVTTCIPSYERSSHCIQNDWIKWF